MALTPDPPLALYSTITSLAYWIAQKYYTERHYVWCAPARHADRFAPTNPPSSDPIKLSWVYHNDVVQGDAHSAAIERNRIGIIRGAEARHRQDVIDGRTRRLIEATSRHAHLIDFKPLLLVIPFAGVNRIVRPASLRVRARAAAEEYIIEDLPRSCFDVIELQR
jgi:hypothetical protein